MFSQNLEKAVIETIEAGHMTKDLAICVHGWNVTEDQYLMTEPFMDEIKVSQSAESDDHPPPPLPRPQAPLFG